MAIRTTGNSKHRNSSRRLNEQQEDMLGIEKKSRSIRIKQKSRKERAMKKAVQKTINHAISHAKNLCDAAGAAWAFATAVLWPGKVFSEGEALVVKTKLALFFAREEDTELALAHFFERILLARKYRLRGDELLLPSEWFEEKNQSGYPATALLAEELKRIRQSVPAAMPELSILTLHAVEFSKSPSPASYRVAIESMLVLKEPGLAELFRCFAANLHYGL